MPFKSGGKLFLVVTVPVKYIHGRNSVHASLLSKKRGGSQSRLEKSCLISDRFKGLGIELVGGV